MKFTVVVTDPLVACCGPEEWTFVDWADMAVFGLVAALEVTGGWVVRRHGVVIGWSKGLSKKKRWWVVRKEKGGWW